MGSIRGRTDGDEVHLIPADGSAGQVRVGTSPGKTFEFANVPAGWYILCSGVWFGGVFQTRQWVQAVRVGGNDVDLGLIEHPVDQSSEFALTAPVWTVCEALDRRDRFNFQPAVVVGVFKSGMDETLRLDCPTELVSGSVGWPSSIGLNKVDPPPENLRDQIEAKRQEILKSAPPNAPLRPERVVGLYGHFVALAGLAATKCCSSQIQTSLPPARLFGMHEADLRVIR